MARQHRRGRGRGLQGNGSRGPGAQFSDEEIRRIAGEILNPDQNLQVDIGQTVVQTHDAFAGMIEPRGLECANCNHIEYRVLADDHPNGVGVQLICANCRHATPVFQLQVLQLTDALRDHLDSRQELYIPDGPKSKPEVKPYLN